MVQTDFYMIREKGETAFIVMGIICQITHSKMREGARVLFSQMSWSPFLRVMRCYIPRGYG